jgi:hypothetical protein
MSSFELDVFIKTEMVCAMDRRGVSIWSSMLYRSNCRALKVIVAKRILIVFLFVSLGGFDPRTAALNDEGKPVRNYSTY